ncbi:MAG: hypothetical protein PHF17_01150 [Arcobacteraceae bacterium]|jgi:hypothetical protein|nr:hypothetical protein [Arcobacteraceae bacterium]
MGYLLYSSNEMFSSTNLIRQSKQIFDKLQEKEIEKAVILRDGKPSFIMLDFEFYEKMMAEYSILKENSLKIKQTKKHTIKQILDQPIEQQIKQNKLAIENEMHIIQKDSDSVISHQSSDPLSVDLSQDFKDEHNGEIKEFWDK